MNALITNLAALPGWIVLVAVALLPAMEASTFVGLVVPGEIIVLVGDAVAHGGMSPLWAVMTAAAVGAAVGGQIGYLVGRRHGRRLLDRLPGRLRMPTDVDHALALVARRGAVAVALGRWVATLRTPGLAGTRRDSPGLAGMSGLSGLSQTRLTIANVTGGTLWSVTISALGYAAGAPLDALEDRLDVASDIVTR